ncbi:uncharacterized protein ACIBXB_013475 isoform 1-T2 [Morphnus guianensis]
MSPRASREAWREKRARAARLLLSPCSLPIDMVAGPLVVSRADRYRQPSVGTAAPKGAGIAVGGAGQSCAPLRLCVGRGEASTSASGGVMVPPPPPPRPPWWVEGGKAELRWAPRLLLAAWTGLRPSPCGGCSWHHGLARAMLGSPILATLVPIPPQQLLWEGIKYSSWCSSA